MADAAEDAPRAGAHLLALLANPVSAQILRAHLERPLRLAELHDQVGWAAHTTLRTAVANLRQIGALRKNKLMGTPYAVETVLTPAGEEMVEVADVLDAWLARAPQGPIAPDNEAAKGAIKALAGGWSSTVMGVLAAKPLTLTELDRLIPEISYPRLERRMTSMRACGLVEPVESESQGTPYAVTDWLRLAVAPLGAATRWERRHLEGGPPLTSVEVEAGFMLAVSLVPLSESPSGTCALAVERVQGATRGAGEVLAGVTVKVENGETVVCMPRLSDTPRTWVKGPAETWFDAVLEGSPGDLHIGGADTQLAHDLVTGIHTALFADRLDVQAK
jgi:DNA-binding HxlR family transcriptional regulator